MNKNTFVDLIVIDTINDKAYIFGYDGELTMKVPESLYKSIKEKTQDGYLNKEKK